MRMIITCIQLGAAQHKWNDYHLALHRLSAALKWCMKASYISLQLLRCNAGTIDARDGPIHTDNQVR